MTEHTNLEGIIPQDPAGTPMAPNQRFTAAVSQLPPEGREGLRLLLRVFHSGLELDWGHLQGDTIQLALYTPKATPRPISEPWVGGYVYRPIRFAVRADVARWMDSFPKGTTYLEGGQARAIGVIMEDAVARNWGQS